MTTPNFEYFLVFKIRQFITSKRPGLEDFCLFFEMEECTVVGLSTRPAILITFQKIFLCKVFLGTEMYSRTQV